MSAVLIVIIGCSVLLLLAFRRYHTYRGQRMVSCPETQQPVGLELDAWLAAADLSDATALRVKNCSRWPEKADCGQECVAIIDASPESSLIRNIAAAWYQGKSCVYCRRTIGEIRWPDELPGVRGRDGVLKDWTMVAATDVPAVLETYGAVCWSCNLAEQFRLKHPELVTDRPGVRLRKGLVHSENALW